MQGNVWKSKYKSDNDATILPLLLYYDDFEPGNALGSHAVLDKIKKAKDMRRDLWLKIDGFYKIKSYFF